MSIMDYMPHRMLINYSLRKESEKLRSKISSCQLEYDMRVQKCQEEIERAENEKNAELERIKESFNDKLKSDKDLYDLVQSDIYLYIDVFLQRKLLTLIWDNKSLQTDIIKDDIIFLNDQMTEIGKEIDLLCDRKKELSANSNVEDIIKLTNECGYEIPFSTDDTADIVLKKIQEAIKGISSEGEYEKYALKRLIWIIQERSDYYSALKYLDWFIQQKINYSKQLKKKREKIKKHRKKMLNTISEIESAIDKLSSELETTAKRIRLYWTKQIVYLNAEIDYLYMQKKDYKDQYTNSKNQIIDVASELKKMASRHSDNQYKWNRLQKDYKELSENIESLDKKIEYSEKEIEQKKADKKNWYDKRDSICSLFKLNNVTFISNKKISDDDEKEYIENRLAELDQIRNDAIEEAKQVLTNEITQLTDYYDIKLIELNNEYIILNEQYQEICAQYNQKKGDINKIESEIKSIKANDNRFIISRLFSEPPSLTEAQNRLNQARVTLSELEQKCNTLYEQVLKAYNNIEGLKQQKTQDLDSCVLRPLRPTSEECREEELLKLRKKNIRERGNGYKN